MDIQNNMSSVSIVKCGKEYNEIREGVFNAIELIGGLEDIIKPGFRVLVKPNIVDKPQQRLNGAVTRWEVTAAVCEAVAACGAIPFVGDSSSIGVDTDDVFDFCGYDNVTRMGYEVIDFKDQPSEKIPVENGKKITEISTYKVVKEADAVITVPIMKTHDQLEVTLGVKNIKGIINDSQKKLLHKIGVVDGVVDVFQTVKPVLCITDATVGQEGFGPLFGTPVEMGLIVASKDTVACDAISSMIMGHPADISPVTLEAAKRNLGEIDFNKIEVLGESIDTVKRRFKRFSEVGWPKGIPEFNFIVGENSCTGCRDTMYSTLFQLKEYGTEQKIGGLNVVVGSPEQIPDFCNKNNTVLVGNCSGKFQESGEWVKGCPPNRVYIHEAFEKLQTKKQ